MYIRIVCLLFCLLLIHAIGKAVSDSRRTVRRTNIQKKGWSVRVADCVRLCGVMVSTGDSESPDLGSIPGTTCWHVACCGGTQTHCVRHVRRQQHGLAGKQKCEPKSLSQKRPNLKDPNMNIQLVYGENQYAILFFVTVIYLETGRSTCARAKKL